MKEKALKFLKEYENLCQKYNMGLSSCGCCGSPYLRYFDDFKINDIYYNEELKCITLEGHYNDEIDYDYVYYTLDEYIERLKGK